MFVRGEKERVEVRSKAGEGAALSFLPVVCNHQHHTPSFPSVLASHSQTQHLESSSDGILALVLPTDRRRRPARGGGSEEAGRGQDGEGEEGELSNLL
jgi:hypothetical protein